MITIPTGESASAGKLNDYGLLKNFGTLNFGKSSANPLYELSYKYHIRGGLKSINTDANNNWTNTLFSYRLDYEDDGAYFDGNIRNQYWKSNIDGIKRAYEYSYDGDSRLKGATYASEKAGENYALSGITYDFNGNIKTLSRNGATNLNFTTFDNVDNLNYTYPSNSNKLSKIQDLTTSNTDVGDFRDGTNTDDDYDYWADGSLKRDRNKGIDSIRYNYLKLPERIKFANGRTITTEYDAEGTKLKKIVSDGETTDYEEDDIYVNGKLYQTSHDEGRIVEGVYEYNITDQNNDLRIAFKDSLGIAVPTQSIFYDPWGLSMKGMAITRNPLNFNRYQFLNRETQFETGFIDLKNRQYNPQTGRFTSQDPVIEGQEHLSLYQYGWNNPVLRPDPNGDCPLCPLVLPFLPEIGAGLAVVGEAIATTVIGVGIGKAVDELAHSGISANHSGMGNIPGIDYSGLFPSPIMKSSSSNVSSNSQSQSGESQKTKTEQGKSHGNKLDDKPAEGYTLRDKKTNDVKKYGETTRGEDKFGDGKQKRYGKKELEEKGVNYKKEESGTKKDMHKWQNEKIKDHKNTNDGKRPDLNKSDY